MQFQLLFVSMVGLASAYYKPDLQTYPEPSNNAIHTPVAGNLPGGQSYEITWTPDTPGKVSIIFLQGPANNVQYYRTIADSIDNSGSFTWDVPSDIPAKNLEGYAIEIIAEDGRYQYSPQIGLSQDGSATASGDSDSTITQSVSSYGSVETAPPSSGAEGTAECGALAECPSTTTDDDDSAYPTETSDSVVYTSAATGTGNVSVPIVTPTAPLTVPSTLASVAQPITSTAVVGLPATTVVGGTQSSAISTGLAAPAAKLSGAAAVVAGLLGLLAL